MTAKKLVPEPIAIIGMACRFPQADSLNAYWANILNSRDCISAVPEKSHWDPQDFYDPDPNKADSTYAKRGGFLGPQSFDPLAFSIPPKALEATDTSQLIGLMVAGEALEDAGYGKDRDFDREKVSTILGVTGTLELVIPLGARLGHPVWRRALKAAGLNELQTEEIVAKIAAGFVPWQDQSFPGLLGNVVAGRIANFFDLGGTNCVSDAACASALSALNLAAMELWTGKADMVLSGGIDTLNDIFMYMCFSKTPALSLSGEARPFSATADGTLLGEGAGIIVLKRLADAERDGDRIYATLRSVGSSSDGKGNAIYAPNVAGQTRALSRAYDQANLSPDSIGLIEGHGTGTKRGDSVEISALSNLFKASGKEGRWCAVGSVKSQIGHTKAAAGIAGLIKSVLALNNRVLPPTIKVERPLDPLLQESSPLFLNNVASPWITPTDQPRRAGVSAFGFGGSNFHCIVEESPQPQEIFWDGQVQIFAFTGATREEIKVLLRATPTQQTWQDLCLSAAKSLRNFNGKAKFRLIILLEQHKTELAKAFTKALTLLDKLSDKTSWSAPEGIYFGSGEPAGKLGILFPGQGSQYVGMLRDLACRFPQMQRVLADVDKAFADCEQLGDDLPLTQLIYPPPKWDKDAKAADEQRLRRTDNAQPAIGAISIGLLKLLNHFKIQPDTAAGHSYGEIPALCASNRFDADALYLLSRLRGKLMATGDGDRGAMLAVRAPATRVTAIVQEARLDLVLANKNAPDQVVLSGPTSEIDRATTILNQAGLRNKRLSVAAAFHSALVAQASEPFYRKLSKMALPESQIPVYSNTTGKPYPSDPEEARHLLANQLSKPVEFVEEIRNMFADGVHTFLEVGPGARLTALVKSILEGSDFEALAVDASSGKRLGCFDLARVLANLAVQGHQVDLTAWENAASHFPPPLSKKPAMAIEITGANYVSKETRSAAQRPIKPIVIASSTNIPSPIENATIHQAEVPTLKSAPSPTKLIPTQSIAPANLAEALRANQQNMAFLQKMQIETARLHSSFLQSQATANQSLQQLMDQQQLLLAHGEMNLSGVPQVAVPQVAEPQVAVPQVAVPLASVPDLPPLQVPQEPQVVSIPEPVAPAATSNAELDLSLIRIISEKTGYPEEMLELSMTLDGDLGIDSIKRVEILSALQEALPSLPAIEPDQMGRLETLSDIVVLLSGKQLAPATSPTQPADQILYDIVAEKTGYPPEMLDPAMSLDSDLGIDSIKRVEIFSALQEEWPDLPEIKPDQIGAFQSLQEIADFLQKHQTNPAPSQTISVAPSAQLGASLLEVVSDKTGYPLEMLDLSMSLEGDLGIDSIKRVEILSGLADSVPNLPEPKPGELSGLQTLSEIVAWFSRPLPAKAVKTPSKEQPSLTKQLSQTEVLQRQLPQLSEQLQAETPLALAANSLLWLAGENDALTVSLASTFSKRGFEVVHKPARALLNHEIPERLSGLLIVAPETDNASNLLQALMLAKATAPALRAEARKAASFFVTVTRLDGAMGFHGSAQVGCNAGLSGLAKTVRHEWPEVACKAIDVAPLGDPNQMANQVIEHCLSTGNLEVGISPERLLTLVLESQSLSDTHRIPLQEGDVVLVSGGARGVTAACALALAKRFRPSLVLLGRSPMPETEEANNTVGIQDEADLKRAILAGSNKQLNPKSLENAFRQLQAEREVRTNLARMSEAGAQVSYHSVDLRSGQAVAEIVSQVRADLGPIRGLVHGAGVLADRLIEQKTELQFNDVFGTKVDGMNNLLTATAEDDLKAIVFFSSTTARFGRVGQVDYAMANEVLNKAAQSLRIQRPTCKTLAVNWGPWDGGMVTPALKKVFADEGIPVIPLQAGADYLVEELQAPTQGPVEIVISGQPAPNRAQETAPMEEAFCLDLNVADFPFLQSHVLGDHAVLPVVMMLEWSGHAAMIEHLGYRISGFRAFRVLKGVTLDAQTTKNLRFYTGAAQVDGENYIVPVELRSNLQGKTVPHCRVQIVLASALPERPSPSLPLASGSWLERKPIYENLFHGPHFQGLERVEGCDSYAISARAKSGPVASNWMANPLRRSWLIDPLALDCAFQMMVLWSQQNHDVPSLPVSVAAFQMYAPFPKGEIQLVAQIHEASKHKARADIEFRDAHGDLIARMYDYECVLDASLNDAYSRKHLLQEVPN